ncbi:MAG: hypothetical protein ACI9U2_005005, partial [Bradymonadia bacterium]
LLTIAILLVLAGCTALPLEAALDQVRAERGAEKDVALIVAIEDYDKAPDIPGARANARLWRQWFHARGTRDVRVIEDAGATHGWGRENTPHGLLPKIDAAADQARKTGGTLWFVFIGHGAPVSDRGKAEGVLLAHGVKQTAASLRTHGIFVDADLMPRLAKARKSVAVLDACFSGQSGDGALVPGLQPLIPAAFSVSKAVTVFTAAKGTEFAGPLPGANRPAFSYLMLGALAGWADGEIDRKHDRTVSSEEAFEWVKLQMERTIHGRRQTPTMRGPRRTLSRAWAVLSTAAPLEQRQSQIIVTQPAPRVVIVPRILPTIEAPPPSTPRPAPNPPVPATPPRTVHGTVPRSLVMDSSPERAFVASLEQRVVSKEQRVSQVRQRQIRGMRKILRDKPQYKNKADLLFRIAEREWDEGKYRYFLKRAQYDKEIEAHFNGTLKKKPEEPVRDYSKALKEYKTLLKQFPNYTRIDAVMFYLGRGLQSAGKKKEGADYMLRLTRVYPKSKFVTRAYLAVGATHEVVGTFADPNEPWLALKDGPRHGARYQVIAKLKDGVRLQVQQFGVGYKKLWMKVRVVDGPDAGRDGYVHGKWVLPL